MEIVIILHTVYFQHLLNIGHKSHWNAVTEPNIGLTDARSTLTTH